MPYTPAHKEQTRKRILECARQLFIARGYSEVSIDEIMAEAGLTRGGFYNHFKNKEDLFAAAITSFMDCNAAETIGMNCPASASNDERAHAFVNAYLSDHHLGGQYGLCPLIALPTDVARAGPAIKDSYRKLFEGMVKTFESSIPAAADGQSTGDRALALAATCVGGMILARAMGDEALSDRIRSAALAVARETLNGGKESAEIPPPVPDTANANNGHDHRAAKAKVVAAE